MIWTKHKWKRCCLRSSSTEVSLNLLRQYCLCGRRSDRFCFVSIIENIIRLLWLIFTDSLMYTSESTHLENLKDFSPLMAIKSIARPKYTSLTAISGINVPSQIDRIRKMRISPEGRWGRVKEAMNEAQSTIRVQIEIVYSNYISILSRYFTEELNHLHPIFDKLSHFAVWLKLKKCFSSE